MATNIRRNPLAALLDYALARGDEATSIGSVMSQLAKPVLASQGVQVDGAVQRGAVPQPTLASTTPAAPAAPVAPVTPLPKTTSDAEEYYIREYQKRGLARPAAEGIVAGMGSESGLNPTVNERSPVVPGSRGGFGLYQLTGPRRIAFERWASENGKNVNDDQSQIDFMMTEFAGPERKAYDALIAAPDAQSAATVFTDQFLRPGVSHSAQSANSAARMSGQPYNPAMAGGGAMAAAGGALPQTVEGILSSLYPDASGDEKAAHRKDILMGLSQGLSALSQGRPVDLSNIAANADQRRRQYVLDTREKEKAKAAASLVYSQTGDANMAAGIASGAINYSDVLNERQMKRAEQTAQDARLKDAATSDALVTAMKAGKMPQETIDLVQKGGVDALSAYQKIQADQTLLEQEAKQEDIKAQNVADAQYILSTAAPGSPEARAAERVVALGGAEEFYTLMKDRAPPAGAAIPDQIEYADALVAGGKYQDRATALQAILAKGADGAGGTANIKDAQALVDSGAINPVTGKEFTLAEATAATVLAPRGPQLPSVTVGPDGTISFGPPTAAGGVPAAAGGVPAAAGGVPAAAGGVPAATVGNAFNTFGSVNDAAKAMLLPGELALQDADLAAKTQETAAAAALAPVELQNAQADLAAREQENRKNAATETDEVAKAAYEAEAARLANEKAILDFQIAQTSQEPDLELKRLAIEKATADLAAAQQAATDTKKIAEDKAAQRQIQATVSADTVMRYGKDILDMTSDWSDSVLAGGVNIVAGMIPRSEVSEVADRVSTIKNLTALDSLTAMRNSSPTGAAVGNVSDTEGKRLEARYGALNVKGDPVKLREDIHAAMNAYLDTVYGTPEQIRQRYEDGKITGAIADAYSARYSTRGAGVDPAAANVGGITTLGLTDTDMTVLGSLSGADSLLAPDTLTPEERAILDSLTAPAGGK